MEVEVYADVVRVRKVPTANKAKQQRGDQQQRQQRGRISGFSRRSRHRMIEQLAKLRNVTDGHFVHLTYPDDVPHTPGKAKRDMIALRMRLMRRFPLAGAIWRMELMPRKSGQFVGQLAPHFHVLLFGVPVRSALLRAWIQLVWSRIVYETDNPPRKVRTRVDAITSRKHAARYCSKYAAKEEPQISDAEKIYEIHNWGRRWASFGALDFAAALVITMTAAQVIALRRFAVRWLHARGSRFERRLARGSPHNGFAVLGLGDQSVENVSLFETSVLRALLSCD